MKTCCRFLTLLSVVFALNSCSNEVEVLANYEENAIVYGLLDPSQPVQLIKINKVFTNPNTPAGDVAKIADSLYFDSLTPTLTEIGTGRAPIKLTRANILLKNDGIFATSPNYLYATTEKISSKFSYRLEFYLPVSKKHIVSVTDISDPVTFLYPASLSSSSSIPSLDFQEKEKHILFTFKSPRLSKTFDGFLYFSYLDVNKADTNIKTIRTVSFKLFSKSRTDNTLGSQDFSFKIFSASFYDFLQLSIPVDASVERRFLNFSCEIYAGNLELDNYIQATEPSIGIVQKQTEYTNILNGLGIFASRRVTKYNSVLIGPKMKTVIVTDDNLKKLGFVY